MVGFDAVAEMLTICYLESCNFNVSVLTGASKLENFQQYPCLYLMRVIYIPLLDQDIWSESSSKLFSVLRWHHQLFLWRLSFRKEISSPPSRGFCIQDRLLLGLGTELLEYSQKTNHADLLNST